MENKVNMSTNIDQNIASRLWEACSITVDRFHAKIMPHEKSTFLGYADITVDASAGVPGLKLKLRGIEVKVLKGNNHLDMPSEKGADGQYYPRFFPLTGEFRAVLTTAIFRNPQVIATVEAAKAMPVAVANSGTPFGEGAPAPEMAAGGDNPFS